MASRFGERLDGDRPSALEHARQRNHRRIGGRGGRRPRADGNVSDAGDDLHLRHAAARPAGGISDDERSVPPLGEGARLLQVDTRQIVQCIQSNRSALSTFRSASDTALVAAMMARDAAKDRTLVARQSTPLDDRKLKPRRMRSLVTALFRR